MSGRLRLALLLLVVACATRGAGAQATFVTYRNAWSGTVTYAVNDTVDANGQTWISTQAGNVGNAPATGSAFWKIWPVAATGSTFNGGTVTSPLVAPGYTSSAPSGTAGYVTMVGGTPLTPLPSNSANWSAPAAVAVPYMAYMPPAAPTAPGQTFSCNPPDATGHFSCSFVNPSGGGSLGDGVVVGGTTTTGYAGIAFNGTFAAGQSIGVSGRDGSGTSGTLPNQWYDVPSSGNHVFRVNNTEIARLALGGSSGTYMCFSVNGNCNDNQRLGFTAAVDGSDNSIYYDIPTGYGQYAFRIAGNFALAVIQGSAPTGACGGSTVANGFKLSLADGLITSCKAGSWVSR